MAKKSVIHKVVKLIIQVVTICLALIFFLTSLVPYLNPAKFWWMGLVGLVAPYTISLLILSIIFWLFVKPLWSVGLILLLAMGYQQLNVVFAYHFKNSFHEERNTKNIRIVDWNIRGFNGISPDKNSKKLVRLEVAESILKLVPDIICLQEFNHSYNSKLHPNQQADNIGLFIKTHPYYYFAKDYKTSNGYASGSIIFSRFPIIDTGVLKFLKGESALFTDILVGNDTVRIYTVHLKSFKFKQSDYDNIEKLEKNDSTLTASKSIFDKMNPVIKSRAIQVDLLKKWLSTCPYSSVIAGDFNDVPNSYTYFSIKDNRHDAFLEKSFGIGRTFSSIAPTLRIDYILPDKSFNVTQFKLEDEGLSDHFMLVTDLIKK